MNTDEPLKASRSRSPAYPSVSLPAAIEMVRRIWDAQRKNESHIDSVLKVLGYGRSGTSLRMIAAMGHYGLIEESGSKDSRKIRVSESAQDILHLTDGDPRRQNALRAAALLPAIHAALWERYGALLPDDALIRPFLIRDKEFNDTIVDKVIENYRESFSFAKMDKTGDAGASEANVQPVQGPPKSAGLHFGNPFAVPQTMTTAAPVATPTELPILIGENRHARIPFPMTEDDFDLLIGTLQLWKKKLISKVLAEFPPMDAIWRNKDHDMPVRVTGIYGIRDGETYYRSETGTGIKASELLFKTPNPPTASSGVEVFQ